MTSPAGSRRAAAGTSCPAAAARAVGAVWLVEQGQQVAEQGGRAPPLPARRSPVPRPGRQRDRGGERVDGGVRHGEPGLRRGSPGTGPGHAGWARTRSAPGQVTPQTRPWQTRPRRQEGPRVRRVGRVAVGGRPCCAGDGGRGQVVTHRPAEAGSSRPSTRRRSASPPRRTRPGRGSTAWPGVPPADGVARPCPGFTSGERVVEREDVLDVREVGGEGGVAQADRRQRRVEPRRAGPLRPASSPAASTCPAWWPRRRRSTKFRGRRDSRWPASRTRCPPRNQVPCARPATGSEHAETSRSRCRSRRCRPR